MKKPKIKLTTSSTPKTANGAAATPKSSKAAESKSAKSKSKKAKEADEAKAEAAPKEPELSAEDKRARKEVRLSFTLNEEHLLTRPTEGGPVPPAQAPEGSPD